VELARSLHSCPDPGRNLGSGPGRGHDLDVHTGPFDDLVAHLVRSTPLSPSEAARVVAEVVGYFAEPVQEFVQRRHRELKRRGLRNEQIFEVIARELATRRVRAPELSARQLRRMVYG
jgi:exonuclease VII large subunit